MNMTEVERLIKGEFAYFLKERQGWSLSAGPRDLELVSHAMRVLLHTNTTPDFVDEYIALTNCQNADGGWSPLSADPASRVWVSAFCGLMLIRANRLLNQDRLTRSVQRAIDYFLDTQRADGRWVDPAWADLDTTSHPVSFFNVVMALRNGHRRTDVRWAWARGMRFIMDNQGQDGGWYDHDFHPSGVEITAHLIQDALVADLVGEGQVSGVRAACARGVDRLVEWQREDGSWDDENVDHTMDCTRSLMLVTHILEDEGKRDMIQLGLSWIIQNKNEHGWGDFPGMQTNLERTCDGIDTLLKSRSYFGRDRNTIIKLWGYTP